MPSLKIASAVAAGALLAAGAASAQTPYNSTPYNQSQSTQSQDRSQEAFTAILGALFGDRLGVSSSLESEWSRGRRPLATQRTQFETRLNADVRSGQLTSASAARLRTDYDALVDLEARYTADGRVTTQERSDLAQRYRDFSQRLAAGSDYQDGRASVSDGRAEFERRVDAAVSARRLTRTEGNRLKSDYYALVQVESGYLRDGRLTSQERDDLDARLDALDARVGDTGYGNGGGYQDARTRIAEIERAISRSGSGVGRNEIAQIRVELGDLTRLEAAYARSQPSSDDRSYLDRRLGELEVRARVNRR